MLIPSKSTKPELGFVIPVSILIVVVFPAPLGPKYANNSPLEISRSIPFNVSTCPNFFCKIFN